MKEYLLKTEDGEWIYSNTGESFSYVEKIEIPEGAEVFMDGFNTNRGYAFYKDNFDMVHGDNRYWEGCSKADISRNGVVRWQREPKYKEFLNKNDNYNLVMLPEHAGDDKRSGLIEVPDGAESAYFYSGSNGIEFYKKDSYFNKYYLKWDHCYSNVITGDLVWQRNTEKSEDNCGEVGSVEKTVDSTLSERQASYGCFEDVAFVTENIINVLKKCNYDSMPETHRMAMYMIASKMARLVNGDCNHLDSWHDIQGYAKLVEKIIEP